MTIRDLTAKAAETLAADPVLAGVPVIVEDKGDVANMIALALAKRRLAIVVSWSGFTAESSASATIVGRANLVVTVFEQPLINRRSPNAVNILTAAATVAYALNLAQLGDDSAPLVFKSIGSVEPLTGDGEKSTVCATVNFETQTTL